MGSALADLLTHHLTSHQLSFKKLAIAAKLNPSTVHRWTTTTHETIKVQEWQDLARAARVLGLDRAQTSELLIAGGQPPLAVLERRGLDASDRTLLSPWPNHLSASNVPVRISRFIGREEEHADLVAKLASERLITITGTGGSGKTRLALEVARVIQPLVDRVFFVELAGLTRSDDVVAAVATAIGFQPSDGEPSLLALAGYLRGYRVLLVLDNFEHLLDAGTQIVALQQVARGVTVLVTSRTFLHLQGEREYALDPLPLPPSASGYDELVSNSAVALFVDRAENANRRFRITPDNAAVVAGICARLDGLPLAIELAAARTRELPLSRMQEQLSAPLDLAVDGPRDVTPRQSTLRGAIAWSCSLLDDQTQRWFMLLAVFAGGFTREAMAALGSAGGLGADAVTRGLMALVNQRLVRKVQSSQDELARYTMLETIREYAIERLTASGMLDVARAAHAEHFLDLAERADLSGPDQVIWYARLAAERDNIRAALDWCRDRREQETGLRLTLAMLPFWEQRNPAADSLAWLQSFMNRADDVPPRLWARGLMCLGLFTLNSSANRPEIGNLFDQALAIFQRERDRGGESEAIRAMGDAHVHWREWELARQRYRESLDAAEQSGDAQLIAMSHMGMAFSAPALDGVDGALPHWEATLAWAQQSGHRETIGKATNSLGELARHREDWDIATHNYEQALAIGHELGSDFLVALASHNLGYAALGNAELPLAAARFTESLRLYLRLRQRKGTAECLAGLARVAVSEGNDDRAAHLCGAAAAFLDEVQTQFDTMDRADYERTLATLHDRLGPKRDVLLIAGGAMSRDDAVSYAFIPS